MPVVDQIRYDVLAQDALRGVIRTVLADVAVKGLPGEHHFYITFDTRAEGVRLSPRLKARHPEEMTIVLQHQFWDLSVRDDDFDVSLSFNGIPERLHIPFRAVKAFLDPSVDFRLLFAVESDAADDSDGTSQETAAAPADETPAKEQQASQADHTENASVPPPAKEGGSAEVVSLDRFRKK